MLKNLIPIFLLAVAMASAGEYYAAPAIIGSYGASYATPYIAPYAASPYAAPPYIAAPYAAASVALAKPYVYSKLSLPAAAAYSQYSTRIATPDSYSEQYRTEHKPLTYSAIGF